MGEVEHSSSAGSSAERPTHAPSSNTPPGRSGASAGAAREADPVNLIGRQVGRYLIERFLGSGGVAAVYQAYDQVQGQSVALKMLPATADEKTLMRFRREAMTSGALRHPNIVRTLQVGMSPRGDMPYIAMELIEGESLSELLALRNFLNPIESCSVLEPIAAALAHAHEAGIVHRDVKPSNILLRPAAPGHEHAVVLESVNHPVVPMLSDFGIARSLDSPDVTSTGRTVGTPAYMAPEQCAGRRNIDGRADIYSLGAVLYRCLAGRPPFSGNTTQILHAHVYEPIQIEESLFNRLSPQVVDILRRSLAKRPEERYAHMGEMAEALALAAGRPVTPSREITPVERGDATATMTLSSLPAAETRPANYTMLVPGHTPAAREQESPPRARTAAVTIAPALNTAPRARRSWTQRLEQINWAALAALSVGTLVVAFLVTWALNGPLRTNVGVGNNAGVSSTPSGGVPDATSTNLVMPPGIPLIATPPTPTPSAIATEPPTPTTPTMPTSTATTTPLPTEDPALLPLPTWTPTEAPTATLEPTVTETPTETLTPTLEPTATWTPSVVVTETPTPTVTFTSTPMKTPPTPTWTPAPAQTSLPEAS